MICNLFKKKKAPPVPNDYGSSEEKKYSWGIIIPHTRKSSGAKSPDGISEYVYALAMSSEIAVPRETRDDGGVALAAKRLTLKGCNASLEPHLNAYNGEAQGYEILVIKGDSLSKEYALLFVESFKTKYPERRMRHGNGVKEVVSGDRGYANLVAAKKEGMQVALLSEMFFIDNKKEFITPKEMATFWRAHLQR